MLLFSRVVMVRVHSRSCMADWSDLGSGLAMSCSSAIVSTTCGGLAHCPTPDVTTLHSLPRSLRILPQSLIGRWKTTLRGPEETKFPLMLLVQGQVTTKNAHYLMEAQWPYSKYHFFCNGPFVLRVSILSAEKKCAQNLQHTLSTLLRNLSMQWCSATCHK